MIFVTVGTHEQPFNRLIEYIDNMVRDGIITEEVVMQIGYSTYEPKYCKWSKLIPWDEMQKLFADARIVITHGGPATFLEAIQKGKVPIVVPRQERFNEHVNNHQLEFSKYVRDKFNNIIVVENIDELKDIISDFENVAKDKYNSSMHNSEQFINKFTELIDSLFE